MSFSDVNLDQVVAARTAGRDLYRLAPFFFTPLGHTDSVMYRHEVFRDLETAAAHQAVKAFAVGMKTVRERLDAANRLRYRYQKERWFLNAVRTYCETVTTLSAALGSAQLSSRGLLGLRDYLSQYAESQAFRTLQDLTERLEHDLSSVRYCLLIDGTRITVGHYDGEADYSEAVSETFARFQQGEVRDYRTAFTTGADMDHVAAGILDRVAMLYPDLFGRLDEFCGQNTAFTDATIETFDRELQFYLTYLDYLTPLREAGLPICYPQVSSQSKELTANDTFDLALATKLTIEQSPVVRNDIHLTGAERILVVTGPNQGGKTTMARTFGQLHYLASIGCPVPGRDVRLHLCDQVFTLFEREEDIGTLAGKLQDDLHRMREVFDRASTDSVIIFNEIFTSTSLQDAMFLSRELLDRVTDLDALGVCVTFLDELTSLNEKTVSMVSTVMPGDAATRTYKLIRKPADGRAYALSLAQKYGLTYDTLKERITA